MLDKVILVDDFENKPNNNDSLKIRTAIETYGIKVDLLKIDENIHSYLKNESNILIFNLIPLFGNKYSKFIPAYCDLLQIPYTGSGIFAISSLSSNFYNYILKYHKIPFNNQNIKEKYQISILGNKDKIIFNTIFVDYEGKSKIVNPSLSLKIEKIIKKLQNILKIHDYFTLHLVKPNSNEQLFEILKITLSPDLSETSKFIEILKLNDLSFNEIIGLIILNCTIRYGIAIPMTLKQLQTEYF